MLGIIIALEKEALPILKNMENKKESCICSKKIFTGSLFNKDIVLIISDVGKVNAAMSTMMLIDIFKVNTILNIGLVGSTNSNTNIFDLVVIDKAMQYDCDLTVINNTELGTINNFNDKYIYLDSNYVTLFKNKGFKVCSMATADKFTYSSKGLKLLNKHNLDTEDMELGAIAQVCTLSNIKLISIKCITNKVSKSGTKDFINNTSKAISIYENNLSNIMEIITNGKN